MASGHAHDAASRSPRAASCRAPLEGRSSGTPARSPTCAASEAMVTNNKGGPALKAGCAASTGSHRGLAHLLLMPVHARYSIRRLLPMRESRAAPISAPTGCPLRGQESNAEQTAQASSGIAMSSEPPPCKLRSRRRGRASRSGCRRRRQRVPRRTRAGRAGRAGRTFQMSRGALPRWLDGPSQPSSWLRSQVACSHLR